MIKRKLRGAFFALATLVLAGALVAPAANAASVIDADYSAFARLDWGSLEVVTSSGTATTALDSMFSFSVGGVGTNVAAAGDDTRTRGLATDWVTARDFGIDFPNGGRAEFEYGETDLIASTGANTGSAAVQLARGGRYNVTGSGTVDIRIPYEYSIAAASGDGRAEVSFLVEADGAAPAALSFFGADDPVEDNGVIELQLAVADGGSFGFNTNIISEVAAVPLPAAWLLLASALLVLRRRAPKDTSA